MTHSDEDNSGVKTAYDAYAKAVGGKTFRGERMLEFDELPQRLQFAWRAAAQAVAHETVRLMSHSPNSAEYQKLSNLLNNPAPQITREQHF